MNTVKQHTNILYIYIYIMHVWLLKVNMKINTYEVIIPHHSGIVHIKGEFGARLSKRRRFQDVQLDGFTRRNFVQNIEILWSARNFQTTKSLSSVPRYRGDVCGFLDNSRRIGYEPEGRWDERTFGKDPAYRIKMESIQELAYQGWSASYT